MKARVVVTLKSGVLDRQGKVFDVELGAADATLARKTLSEACERLLANTVIENYAVEIA